MDKFASFVPFQNAVNATIGLSEMRRFPALGVHDPRPAIELASQGSQATTQGTVSGLAPWQINKITRYIAENIDTGLRVRDIANQVRLSVSRFSKGFKVSFGRSPYDYVLAQRVETAKWMITSTNEPLSQIAHACGLSDQAHLSKVFKRFVGTTPLKWRKTGPVTHRHAPVRGGIASPVMQLIG